jgi:hypothetical protein
MMAITRDFLNGKIREPAMPDLFPGRTQEEEI